MNALSVELFTQARQHEKVDDRAATPRSSTIIAMSLGQVISPSAGSAISIFSTTTLGWSWSTKPSGSARTLSPLGANAYANSSSARHQAREV